MHNTRTELRNGLRAAMYQDLSKRDLILYRTGFKNGYRLCKQHNDKYISHMNVKLRMRAEKVDHHIKQDRRAAYNAAYDNFNYIASMVCTRYNLPRQHVLSKVRTAPLARARAIMINLVLEVYGCSLPNIGKLFNLDHTTIIHHRDQKFKKTGFWSEHDPIHEDFENFKRALLKTS